MKHLYLFVIYLFMYSGCATVSVREPVVDEQVYTMKTDMYPYKMSRSRYYMSMAEGYSLAGQNEKAIEYYKLSILHDARNMEAFMGLSDIYMKQDKHLLALIALEDALEYDRFNTGLLKRTGDLFLKAGLYSKARESYQALLKQNKKDEDSLWAVFYVHKLERKYDEALANLGQMVVTEKNAGQIEYEKAMIHKYRRNTLLYSQHIQKAIKLDPRHREILLEYARFSYDKKSYEEATSALLNYSNTHNFDLEVSEHLAFAAVQAENYKVALTEYDKQKTIAADVVAIDLKRAHCFYLMGDLFNAERIYLRLAVNENSDEARFYLGQIYYMKNKLEDGTFVLSQIPVYSPFYSQAVVKLSLYYKYTNQDDKAINLLQEAFVKRIDDIEIYTTYADFLIEKKRFVEAVALLEKGIQLFPKNEDLRLKMAYLHFRLNNQKSFKREIKKALRLNPESGDAYAMLSELWYLKERDVDETMYFVQRATELSSKNKNLKPILAWALMQKNRSEEAVALFEQYFEENPKESFFARSLAQVYRRGGVKNKAQKMSELASRLEIDDSLKSRFIFKQETQQVNAEQFKENRTRLPASLEN